MIFMRCCPILWKNRRFGYFLSFLNFFLLFASFMLSTKLFIFEWFGSTKPQYHVFNFPLYVNRAGFSFLVAYVVILILAFISLIRTITTNPGSMGKIEPPKDKTMEIYVCTQCKEWMPPRAYHCSTCNTCIFKKDYHCPWVSNCIGVYNKKYYVLYLAYTGTLCTLTIIFNGIGLVYYISRRKEILRNRTTEYYAVGLMWMIFGLLLAIFFGLMILEPFLTAVYSAVDNQTVPEMTEELYGTELGISQGFKDLMGDDIAFLWLLPVTPTLHVNYMQQLYSAEDPQRLKPEEEPKHFPRPKTIRSNYEVAIWAFVISASVYFVR